MMTPQKLLSDALERVQLDPAVASLPPIEQALKAAALLLMESAPTVVASTPSDLIELSKVEQMAAYYEAPKGFFDWLDAMRGIKLDIADDLMAE
ncbi:hypothetical protein OKW11_006296 [Pseudomonas baetica]|nr:hypothetical protein [Pseudomonas baetica]